MATNINTDRIKTEKTNRETDSKSDRPTALRWRHNERDGLSNHQPQDFLLHRLFRHRSKETPKLRVTGLCAGNSPVTGEFPAQMASNAENVSICWRHHVLTPAPSHTDTHFQMCYLSTTTRCTICSYCVLFSYHGFVHVGKWNDGNTRIGQICQMVFHVIKIALIKRCGEIKTRFMI